MAYNNYPFNYAYNYNPAMVTSAPAIPPQVSNPQNATSTLIWVQGEAGAKSYLIAPNTSVPLWDSESPTIYIKSADSSGMPSMKILDYIVRDSNAPKAEKDTLKAEYVTKAELEEFKTKVMKKMEELEA